MNSPALVLFIFLLNAVDAGIVDTYIKSSALVTFTNKSLSGCSADEERRHICFNVYQSLDAIRRILKKSEEALDVYKDNEDDLLEIIAAVNKIASKHADSIDNIIRRLHDVIITYVTPDNISLVITTLHKLIYVLDKIIAILEYILQFIEYIIKYYIIAYVAICILYIVILSLYIKNLILCK